MTHFNLKIAIVPKFSLCFYVCGSWIPLLHKSSVRIYIRGSWIAIVLYFCVCFYIGVNLIYFLRLLICYLEAYLLMISRVNCALRPLSLYFPLDLLRMFQFSRLMCPLNRRSLSKLLRMCVKWRRISCNSFTSHTISLDFMAKEASFYRFISIFHLCVVLATVCWLLSFWGVTFVLSLGIGWSLAWGVEIGGLHFMNCWRVRGLEDFFFCK